MKKSGLNIQFVGRLSILISNMRQKSTKNGFLEVNVLFEVLISLRFAIDPKEKQKLILGTI
jgi:hypothetical protein